MSITEPPRFNRPSRALFDEYVRAGLPLIATGVTEGWSAAAWDEAALEELCGDNLVPVERYTSDQSRLGCWVTETMSLRDYLERMARGENVYLSTVLVNQHFPQLSSKLPFPACIAPERTRDNDGYYLFVGDRQRSETHFHPGLQAVLVNLYGKKRVGLYSPTETDHLYPYRWYEVLGTERIPAFNWSRVLPDTRDQFPALDRLSGYEVVLEPGEMLFIPIHWWHWAESLGPSISVTLLFGRKWGDRMSKRLALRSIGGLMHYTVRNAIHSLRTR